MKIKKIWKHHKHFCCTVLDSFFLYELHWLTAISAQFHGSLFLLKEDWFQLHCPIQKNSPSFQRYQMAVSPYCEYKHWRHWQVHCCGAIQICYRCPLKGWSAVAECIFTITVNPSSLKQMMSRLSLKASQHYFIVSPLSISILLLHLLLHSTYLGIEITVDVGIVQHLVVWDWVTKA